MIQIGTYSRVLNTTYTVSILVYWNGVFLHRYVGVGENDVNEGCNISILFGWKQCMVRTKKILGKEVQCSITGKSLLESWGTTFLPG